MQTLTCYHGNKNILSVIEHGNLYCSFLTCILRLRKSDELRRGWDRAFDGLYKHYEKMTSEHAQLMKDKAGKKELKRQDASDFKKASSDEELADICDRSSSFLGVDRLGQYKEQKRKLFVFLSKEYRIGHGYATNPAEGMKDVFPGVFEFEIPVELVRLPSLKVTENNVLVKKTVPIEFAKKIYVSETDIEGIELFCKEYRLENITVDLFRAV